MTQAARGRQPSAALAVTSGAGALVQPVQAVAELAPKMEELAKDYNVMSPFTTIGNILPMHQVAFGVVKIDPEGDCYHSKRFCQQNERAPGKIALAKLMAAAGVKTLSSERMDDRKDSSYCEHTVQLAIRDFDGTYRTCQGSRTLDLRPGAADTLQPEQRNGKRTNSGKMQSMSDSALSDKRRNISQLCETFALERALRLLLGLKHVYTLDELKRPFVIPKLVPHLDVSDPDVKRALIGVALQGDALLFGRPVLDASIPASLGPAPAAPALAPGEAMQPEHQVEVEPAAPASADAMPALEEEEPVQAENSSVDYAVCGCPCGHQAEVTEEEEKQSLEKVGSSRCVLCYPGSQFRIGLHANMKSLELAKFPDYTPEKAEQRRVQLAGAQS